MNSKEIQNRFLTFFEKRGHAIIPSSSLVPENDPSVLFTTAGMQALVPYLLGEPHPKGQRLVNVQKCVRTGDIEEIGDNTHLTFFEMLGNWSLGDYFKKEAIAWSLELLTSKDEGFDLDVNRLYVTAFEGDDNAPRDDESFEIWKSLGIPEHRIYFMPAKSNWWSAGEDGPCGPDTEMFYDITPEGLGDLTKEAYLLADEEQKVVEIWNDVFMEYMKKDGKVIGKLQNRNVDTGSGLERMAMVLQGKDNVFDTDLFLPIIAKIRELSEIQNTKAERIVGDHIRTAHLMIADGVFPSNTDRGYILRRLLRRAIRYGDLLGMPQQSLEKISDEIIAIYRDVYPESANENIKKVIAGEEAKFRETLSEGLKYFNKGTDAFTLFTTYGFPFELTEELAKEKGQSVDRKEFEEKMKAHQDLSRSGAEQKFKGGLANQSEETVKLHTVHHLLLAALQETLGKEVKQKGSNITEERLRMDFSFPRKLTDDEKKQIEEKVNSHIIANYTVVRREMPRIEAENLGAEMEFGAKYPDVVSVYFIEDSEGNAVSKEFCGGPHIERTGVLGTFKIQKEEAVAAGIRRIKATLS